MCESVAYLVKCFVEPSPDTKLAMVEMIDIDNSTLLKALRDRDSDSVDIPAVSQVGNPSAPTLVEAKHLPKRSLATTNGRGAFFHAICHIEFTAINLALDAALRFPGLPYHYYSDWLKIAQEEAVHFSMLHAHLATMGFKYGDFDAHDGMWQLAERTAHKLLLRMALVPRVLEARGLDVTPPMIRRLLLHNDIAGASILERIYVDEIKHVEAGTRWFNYAAAAEGLEPEQAFLQVVNEEFGELRTNNFNREARLEAGFTEFELSSLGGE